MAELDFLKTDYDDAITSQHATRLELLSRHPSRYVRARVMGNPYTPLRVRDCMRQEYNNDPGLLSWLFQNPALTRGEFVAIYQQ